MKILIIEPFLGGSHRQWAEGYARHSNHEVHILGLPGRHWKWRMHGGAITLARKFRESDFRPDLVLATDMVDLTTFLALTRDLLRDTPVALYFHENQLAYPWSPDDADPRQGRDNHYCFINFSSALAADAVFFNSAYNRDSFLQGLGPFLKQFPDHREAMQIEKIVAKSEVLPLGMDLRRLDLPEPPPKAEGAPVILWNHRWEYDKGPDEFFRVLERLAGWGMPFRLVVLGQAYGRMPESFLRAQRVLRERILHWGYAESIEEYAGWLWRSDILPVTSMQDFFGGSVVEAMYCGVWPLLPRRLAYPEHVPEGLGREVFYEGEEELEQRLRGILTRGALLGLPVRDWVEAYDWGEMGEVYDERFVGMV